MMKINSMKTLIYKLIITLLVVSCTTTKTTTRIDNTDTNIEVTEPHGATQQDLDRTHPPAPGPAPVIQLGTPETFTMANGLKVFVVSGCC